MSLDALRWALKSSPGNASRKLVLISLADRANEEHCAYPSSERLERDTCLNLKTVKKCLRELADAGYIEDTGERKGKTKRVIVWRLLDVEGREDGPPENRPKNGPVKSTQKRNDTKNGIVPNFPENGPKNGPIKSTQNWVAEPPIVLTTQGNHPNICADPADARSTPNDSSDPDVSEPIDGELINRSDPDVVPGWTFADLLDPPEHDPEQGTFIALPLRADQTPVVHFVTDRDVLNLQQTYRSIDVAQECRLMLGWLIGNDAKRKTAKGIRKFISGWLNRAQTNGGSPFGQQAPHLTGYSKLGSDAKTRREQVRNALRDIQNTDWDNGTGGRAPANTPHPAARRQQVRESLRDITNTDW